MSESERAANGRRDFLQTVVAAPVLAAAMVETAKAQPAQRELFVKHAYEEHTVNLGEVVMNYVVSGQATRTVGQSCPHERMLAQVKVPVLLTHHARAVNPGTGQLTGAMSDVQAAKVREIVTAAGQRVEYVSLPDAAHAMHQADPARFAQVPTTWARTLPA